MVLSVHIPKTAGVSLRNVLKEHFGPGYVSFYWTLVDAWGRTISEVPEGATCVHGHFQTDQLTPQFPEAKLITWVRDPVERVASSYYHRLRDPDWQHPVCRQLHENGLSLAEYAELPLVRNEMAHFFGSKQPEDFAFIGIVEQFERSWVQMWQVLGSMLWESRRDNCNSNKQAARYPLNRALRDRILALNEKDAALYEQCCRLWGEKRLSSAGVARA